MNFGQISHLVLALFLTLNMLMSTWLTLFSLVMFLTEKNKPQADLGTLFLFLVRGNQKSYFGNIRINCKGVQSLEICHFET